MQRLIFFHERISVQHFSLSLSFFFFFYHPLHRLEASSLTKTTQRREKKNESFSLLYIRLLVLHPSTPHLLFLSRWTKNYHLIIFFDELYANHVWNDFIKCHNSLFYNCKNYQDMHVKVQ